MITRAAYRLANLLAAVAVRIDRTQPATTGESFPVAGTLLASACLLALAAGWTNR